MNYSVEISEIFTNCAKNNKDAKGLKMYSDIEILISKIFNINKDKCIHNKLN